MVKFIRKIVKFILFKNKSFIVFINYHNLFSPETNLNEENYLDIFEKEIKLYKFFFNFLDLEESIRDLQSKNNIGPTAVITFDDGYLSQYKASLNVLFNLKIKPIHFISSQNLGNKHYWNDIATAHFLHTNINASLNLNNIKYKTLSERDIVLNTFNKDAVIENKFYKLSNKEEIIELHNMEAFIGGHTKDHPILSLENDQICFSQIVDDKFLIEDMLKTSIKHFAYPNGKTMDFGLREKIICTTHGYEYLFTSEPGVFWPATDCSEIPRLSLQIGTPIKNLFYILKMVRDNL